MSALRQSTTQPKSIVLSYLWKPALLGGNGEALVYQEYAVLVQTWSHSFSQPLPCVVPTHNPGPTKKPHSHDNARTNMRTILHSVEAEGDSVTLQVEARLRRWFVLYTASHNEKAVERTLRQKGVETFLPLYRVTKRRKNRTTVKLELPLFASYVFARIALSESDIVRSVPRVFAIVGNARGPVPLPDEEIEALRAGLNEENATPWEQIKVGDRARIRTGPLAGWEGIVIRANGQLHVVLSVDMISKSIAVRVNAEDIDICDSQPLKA